MMQENVVSVSEITTQIQHMFASNGNLQSVFVKGEISNFRTPLSSQSYYFTLKDKAAQLSCIIFASKLSFLSIQPKDGLSVIAQGSIKVYGPQGKYQLYIEDLRLEGVGTLYEQFEKLRQQLDKEGLFFREHKLPIPFYVKRLGIVTALTGAAIQDIIQIAKRRNPFVQLILYPSKVQGVGAEKSLIAGIKRLEQEQVDAIIIGRGGGSIEDLWAFNDEALARTIYNCSIPIISAVGHETDITIVDFVSDLRAPTPSAAAELAVRELSALESKLVDLHSDLLHAMLYEIERNRKNLDNYRLHLRSNSPRSKVEQKKLLCQQLREALPRAMQNLIRENRHRLDIMIQTLQGLSPLNKLQSGFSYVSDVSGKNITSIRQVKEEDTISIAVTDGRIHAKVFEIKPDDSSKHGRKNADGRKE